MTPEEINKFLAEKVMNWELSKQFYSDGERLISPYEKFWHPYTDIKQAFEIVDKLNKNWYVELTRWIDGNYLCTIYESAIGQIVHASTESKTPSEAICLAVYEALAENGFERI